MRDNEAALRQSHAKIEDLAGRLITAQETERARIARELHDDISQRVAAISIAMSECQRSELQASRELLEVLAAAQRQTIALTENVRLLSHDIYPSVLEHADLVDALRSHCGEFANQHSLTVVVEADGDLAISDMTIALCLYRVVQEALRNIAKHANAHRVLVSVRRVEDEVQLAVMDDGKGFNPAQARVQNGGLGLRSIEERIRLVGGRLSIETAPHMGTTITVRVRILASAVPDVCGGSNRVTMRRPSVLIADDHTIVAEGLVKLLSRRFDVVATVADGTALIEAAERLRPDIIIADLNMPSINGLEAMERLKQRGVASKFVILTMLKEASVAAKAMRAGASAFLLKHSAGSELIGAIDQVLNGGTYIAPAVTMDVLDAFDQKHRGEGELTKRQRDVLRLIVEGRRMKEIAAILGLSARTVETHKYEMMRVLGVESTAELVALAVKSGLA